MARMVKRCTFNVMVRKPEGNRPHRKPRFRLEKGVIRQCTVNVILRRVGVTVVAVQSKDYYIECVPVDLFIHHA